MSTDTKIEWTASNNSSYLNGRRTAKNMRAAVREARHYLRNELFGEGKISYFEVGDDFPIRQDEISIQTKYNWVVTEA